MAEEFKQHFTAEPGNIIASEELIQQYEHKVPAALIDIWRTTGFGKYNQGFLELIDPRHYEASLWTWLGRQADNYTPFAITGFGELLYYRRLTATDEDVCMLDIQYRSVETLTWDFNSFINSFLVDEEDKKNWLREDLFLEAIAAKGPLHPGEVFTFVPILALGGAEEVECLQKGDARVYQDLVFQMTG